MKSNVAQLKKKNQGTLTLFLEPVISADLIKPSEIGLRCSFLKIRAILKTSSESGYAGAEMSRGPHLQKLFREMLRVPRSGFPRAC